MASVGAVLFTTDDIGRGAQTGVQSAAIHAGDAASLMALFLDSPGYSKYSNEPAIDWLHTPTGKTTPAPDQIQRLGLLEAGGHSIDFGKLENLRLAPRAADPADGYVNYDEARAKLGLDARGLDFHIRAHPSLRAVQEILDTGVRDRNLKVVYIGDATGTSEAQVQQGGDPPVIGTPTCGLSPWDSRTIRITVPVTNNGITTTQFHIAATTVFGANSFSDVQRSATVGPGAVAYPYVDVPAKHGGCNAVTSLSLDVIDPSATLADGQWTPSWSSAGSSAAAKWFRVNPSKDYFLTSEAVRIVYEGDDLTHKQGNTPGEAMTLTIKQGGATKHGPVTVTVPKRNEDWAFPNFAASSLGPAGVYDIVLQRANGETVTDRLVTVTSAVSNFVPQGGDANAPTTYDYSDAAKIEAGFLEDLVDRFCPYEWDSTTASVAAVDWTPATYQWRCVDWPNPPRPNGNGPPGQPGSVFPDDNKLLMDELKVLLEPGGVPSLQYVNMLVVGSNVDHNTMTSDHVKGTIGRWVTVAGGTLVVFGSEKQTVNWLNAIFKTKLDSSSNGLSAPDVGHPILHVSDDLTWDDYDDRGRAWDLRDKSAEGFTKVVHDNSPDKNAVMAISNPGAYGKGTVIVTSWLPYDLFNDGSQREGPAFTNNLLMQGYRGLFLDYGPPIPDGVQAVPAAARTQVYHPELETLVALTIEVFVFPGA